MKKILIGAIVFVAALAVCLSASATFVGQGVFGYLLIHLAALAGAAYLLPKVFAPVRFDTVFWIEAVIGSIFIVGWIWFLIVAGISNVMAARVFAWLLFSGLALWGVALSFKHGKH